MWIVWFIMSLLIVLVLVLIGIYIKYRHDFWRFMDIPHEDAPKMIDILKNFTKSSNYRTVPNDENYCLLYERFKGTAPFCGFYKRLQPLVLVLDLELIKQILIKDFSNFNDRGVYYNNQRDPLSADLYSVSGGDWNEMRLKLEPIFAKDRMAKLFPGLLQQSDELLYWFDEALNQQHHNPVDIEVIVRRHVLSALAQCVFGLTQENRKKYSFIEFEEMTMALLTTRRHGENMTQFLGRYANLGRRLGIVNTKSNVEAYFLNLIEDIVSQREASPLVDKSQDYLQLLIDIKDQELRTHESTEMDTPKQLREHLMREFASHAVSFLKAGYEFTLHTLMYVFYELAANGEVQQRVRQELFDTLERHDNQLNYECVQQLKYMGQTISETLRLHPVAPCLVRRCLNDYVVPGQPKYIVPRTLYVVIPVHAIHQDHEYYPEPEKFQPERFSSQCNKARDPSTWLSFGMGPRNCIGLHFAQLLMRTALVQVLKEYELSLDVRKPVMKLQDGFSLQLQRLFRPEEGTEATTVI